MLDTIPSIVEKLKNFNTQDSNFAYGSVWV
jgi:hypothetical protein